VAEEDGRILGYAASAPFRTRPAYRWTVETGIYLAPDAFGRGIGRTLLSTLLETLERQGYVAAIGAIALPNPASIALHERLGFSFNGAYRGVGFKCGEWLDVGLWQKELAPRSEVPSKPLPAANLG
jgi:phosphinothricin acetyltransferase